MLLKMNEKVRDNYGWPLCIGSDHLKQVWLKKSIIMNTCKVEQCLAKVRPSTNCLNASLTAPCWAYNWPTCSNEDRSSFRSDIWKRLWLILGRIKKRKNWNKIKNLKVLWCSVYDDKEMNIIVTNNSHTWKEDEKNREKCTSTCG